MNMPKRASRHHFMRRSRSALVSAKRGVGGIPKRLPNSRDEEDPSWVEHMTARTRIDIRTGDLFIIHDCLSAVPRDQMFIDLRRQEIPSSSGDIAKWQTGRVKEFSFIH